MVTINIVFILLPCFFFSSPSDKVSLEYRLPIISWNTSLDLPFLYFLYAIPGSTVRISFAKLLNKWWVKICFNWLQADKEKRKKMFWRLLYFFSLVSFSFWEFIFIGNYTMGLRCVSVTSIEATNAACHNCGS